MYTTMIYKNNIYVNIERIFCWNCEFYQADYFEQCILKIVKIHNNNNRKRSCRLYPVSERDIKPYAHCKVGVSIDQPVNEPDAHLRVKV